MEGSIYLERLNQAQAPDFEFALSFIPYEKAEREMDPLKFLEQESLSRFLVHSLALESNLVATAFMALHETGSAEIEFLAISDDVLRRFGLIQSAAQLHYRGAMEKKRIRMHGQNWRVTHVGKTVGGKDEFVEYKVYLASAWANVDDHLDR